MSRFKETIKTGKLRPLCKEDTYYKEEKQGNCADLKKKIKTGKLRPFCKADKTQWNCTPTYLSRKKPGRLFPALWRRKTSVMRPLCRQWKNAIYAPLCKEENITQTVPPSFKKKNKAYCALTSNQKCWLLQYIFAFCQFRCFANIYFREWKLFFTLSMILWGKYFEIHPFWPKTEARCSFYLFLCLNVYVIQLCLW